jgi:protocatechuate 3,4-dioxygenase beta subunit
MDSHERGNELVDRATAGVTRRRALTWLAGAGGAAVLAACGSSGSKSTAASTSSATNSSSTASASSTATSTTAATASSSAVATQAIPEETAGPYPGDGSNGPNVLTQDGVVRSDITSSFGSMSGTAAGVPTTVELTITDVAKGGAPYAGAAVYAWHCTRDGLYSLYSQGATNQNFLRGVQEADANGKVTFTTIFPGAYSGRWPHIHFEVYPTLAAAKSSGNKIATSQLALPEATCNAVYATTGYEQSVRNMPNTSLAKDNVFSDGADQETPTASGDVNSGITLSLTVPV